MERTGVIHPHYVVCHHLNKTERCTMKYLHTREEVITLIIKLSKDYHECGQRVASEALNKAIELLQQNEDKTRNHHFKKVA